MSLQKEENEKHASLTQRTNTHIQNVGMQLDIRKSLYKQYQKQSTQLPTLKVRFPSIERELALNNQKESLKLSNNLSNDIFNNQSDKQKNINNTNPRQRKQRVEQNTSLKKVLRRSNYKQRQQEHNPKIISQEFQLDNYQTNDNNTSSVQLLQETTQMDLVMHNGGGLGVYDARTNISQDCFNSLTMLRDESYSVGYWGFAELIKQQDIAAKDRINRIGADQDFDFKESIEHLEEIRRNKFINWKKTDYKGNRKSLYIKEIEKRNENLLEVIEKTRFEKARDYVDKYPCLGLRKLIMKIRVIDLALQDPTAIVALGFLFNKGAYLRSFWNILDFFIVITGYLELQGDENGGLNFSGLRVLRVLRPLRTINKIEGLKLIVTALNSAILLLRDAIIILIFFFYIYALVGLSLFQGVLKRRCINFETGVKADGEVLCGDNSDCQAGYYCGKLNSNHNKNFPSYGSENFDNIFYAILNVFISVTLEGWTYIMTDLDKSYNSLSIPYSLSLVFIGSFFLLNLTLAVINSKFNETHKIQQEEKKAKKLSKFKVKAANQNQRTSEYIEFDQNQKISLREYMIAKKAARIMIQFLRQKQDEKKLVKHLKNLEVGKQLFELENIGHAKQIHSPNMNQSINNSNKNSDSEDNGGQIKFKKSFLKRQGTQMTTHFVKDLNCNMTIQEEDGEDDFNNEFRKSSQKIEMKFFSQKQAKEGNTFQSKQQVKTLKMIGNLGMTTQSVVPEMLTGGRKPNDQQELNFKLVEEQYDIDTLLNQMPQDIKMDTIKQPQNISEDCSSEFEHHSSKSDIKRKQEMLGKEEGRSIISSEPDDSDKVKTNSFPTKNNRELRIKQKLQNDFYIEGISNILVSEQDESKSQSKLKSQLKKLQTTIIDKSQNESTNFLLMSDLEKELDEELLKDQENSEQIQQNNDKLDSQVVAMKDKKIKMSTLQIDNINNSNRKKRDGSKLQSPLMSHMKQNSAINDMSQGLNSSTKAMLQKIGELHSKFNNRIDQGDTLGNYINDQNQKVSLAKGQEYTSSSLREVLESRHKKELEAEVQLQNKFTKLNQQKQHEQKNGEEFQSKFQADDLYDEDYNQLEFAQQIGKPYQQKLFYDNQEKDLEQLQMFQLQQKKQPYETLTKLAYGKSLTQLATKQITRKSEALVTSTLSMTFIEKNADKSQLDYAHMTQNEYDQYIHLYSEIKASHNLSIKQIEDKYRSKQQQERYERSNSIGALSLRSSQTNQFMKIIRQAIQNKINYTAMSQNQKRVFKINKQKQLDQQRMFISQIQKGNRTNRTNQTKKSKLQEEKEKLGEMQFTMAEAQKIIAGTYNSDEEKEEVSAPNKSAKTNNKKKLSKDDDNYEIIGAQKRNKLALEKSMFKDKTLLEIKHNESLLDDFETALNQLKETDKQMTQKWDFNGDNVIAARMKKNKVVKVDEIPIECKREFQFPSDMTEKDINLNEIRKYDAMQKRKIKMWSGQDVMGYENINEDLAKYAIEQLNSVKVWPKGIYGYIKRLRAIFKTVAKNQFFENLMILSVVANTVVLSMDRYQQPAYEQVLTTQLNLFFTYLFISELGIKLFAIGIKKYLSDKMNYLDGTVVLLSIIELTFINKQNGKSSLSAFRSIRIFRTFRVLRVARLLKAMRSMQIIMGVISRALSSFMYIAMLLFLFVFIYSLLGMQIYGGMWEFEDIGRPRQNFDSFNTAFLTCFQLMTMENWYQILFYGMKSDVNKVITIIYFISWILIGNYILSQLFLATLIDSFLEEEEEEGLEEYEIELLEQEKIQKELQQTSSKTNKRRKGVVLSNNSSNYFESMLLKEEKEEVENVDDLDEEKITQMLREQGLTYEKTSEKQYEALYKNIECTNRFRVFCYQVMKHRYFERTILTTIVLTSLKLGFDTYFLHVDDSSAFKQISNGIDTLFSCIFIVESIIKTLSMGMVMDKGSYLRDTWNILDFFIVVCSLIDLVFSDIKLTFIKVLRLLRTLRPLRFISHNVGLKMIVIALFESIGPIINVLIVIVLIWLMFAILGVNLWSGKFYQCSILPYKYNTQFECIKNGGVWHKYIQNFDNVIQAMLTLFAVSTLENWPDVMLAVKDASDIDKGPKKDSCQLCPYFFVIFIMVGTFFFLNFFIGVLFLNYQKAKSQESKGLTQKHLFWIDIQKMIIQANPDFEWLYIPASAWRKKVHSLVTNNIFDYSIMGAIIGNMLLMAFNYESAGVTYLYVLDKINIFFTIVFVCESILKIIAYGKAYFIPTWHKFDFFVVITSLLDIAFNQFLSASFIKGGQISIIRIIPQLARVLRVLRVSRLLKMLTKYQGLQALLQTITFSLPELMNVFGLLILVLFMFGVLGVFFFSDIQGSLINGKSYINDFWNFSNVGQAMLILFRGNTGEDWNYIMYSLMEEQKGPNCYGGGKCGNKFSFIYSVAFIIIFEFVFTNLFVLVVLQQFDKYYMPKDNLISQFKNDLQKFKNTWREFTQDKYHCQKINENQLQQFYQILAEPLGMPGVSEGELKRTMLKMGIRSDDGYIYFNELLYRSMRRIYGNMKLNHKMLSVELRTQFKIFQSTMQNQSKGRKIKNQEIFNTMMGKGKSVNPFLTVMFMKMSFNTWLNMTKKVKTKKSLMKRQSVLHTQLKIQQTMMDIHNNQQNSGLQRLSTKKSNKAFEEDAIQVQQQIPQEEGMIYIDLYEDKILLLSSDTSSLEESDFSESEDFSLSSNEDRLASESQQHKHPKTARINQYDITSIDQMEQESQDVQRDLNETLKTQINLQNLRASDQNKIVFERSVNPKNLLNQSARGILKKYDNSSTGEQKGSRGGSKQNKKQSRHRKKRSNQQNEGVKNQHKLEQPQKSILRHSETFQITKKSNMFASKKQREDMSIMIENLDIDGDKVIYEADDEPFSGMITQKNENRFRPSAFDNSAILIDDDENQENKD